MILDGFNREQLQLSWDDKQFYEAVGSSNEIELLTFKFKGIKEGIKHSSKKYGKFNFQYKRLYKCNHSQN